MSANNPRAIKHTFKNRPTLEGAGVHLKRAIGFGDPYLFDPFLLLDDFHSDDPQQYLAGFPWHPHRGIETITYMLEGRVEHGDSLGNRGVISAGDVQWMTAGSGIIHQEMPKGDAQGRMYGFQLWANLPASHKMMAPRYQEIKSSRIPVVTRSNGTCIRVICGTIDGQQGPVRDIITDPQYLDVALPANSQFSHPTPRGYTVFAYVFEGVGQFGAQESTLENGSVILFTDGDQVQISTVGEGVRFLLISGKPIGEPIAWRGPIVMNSQEELRLAFDELQKGTFIKHG
ncbi:MAG: pirin family protein [Anaerolineae bacterium]|nr:pirin family protein [Anaerolineae bacterium]